MIDAIESARSRTFAWIAGLVILFACALPLDGPISTWAHDTGMAGWLKNSQRFTHLLRFPGHFAFTVTACAALLAAAWTAGRLRAPAVWEKPAIIFLAGIFSSINVPLKWMIGRIRPFNGVPPFELHPFRFGLFNAEAGFSFPSGDVSLAVAMSVSLTMALPRLWPLWWTLALVVAVERIAENAHYPSDTIAGAAVGIGSALLARKIVVRVREKYDANPPENRMIPSSGGQVS
jgi:undecaprenyl-diphosphatase